MSHRRMLYVAAALFVVTIVCSVSASAQCPDLSEAGTHHMKGTPLQTDSDKNFNALGLIFRAARDPNCSAQARDKLVSFLQDTKNKRGVGWWQDFLSGAYVGFVMASGLEIGGRGHMTLELDRMIRDVGDAYQFNFSTDPCGLLANDPSGPAPGLQMARRANSCMDDYAIAVTGFGWKTAYWRLSGRYWQTPRAQTITYIKKSLTTQDAICVHSPTMYASEQIIPINGYEPRQCNAGIADLGAFGSDAFLLSLNHGNQAPAYGFGLLSSVAAGYVALSVVQAPVKSTELTANQKKVFQYLWKEAVDATQPTGVFYNYGQDDNGRCYNVRGIPTGPRYIQNNPRWGCEDQQFFFGDASEPTSPTPVVPRNGTYNGYRAKWYRLDYFYDFNSYAKGTGGGFAFNTFDSTGLSSNINEFFGPARYETYGVLGSSFFVQQPPLTAGTAYRMGIRTPNGTYIKAQNMGGSTIDATGLSYTPGDVTWYIQDLDGTWNVSGNPVALLMINSSGQNYYMTANADGSLSATTTVFPANNPAARFTMTKTNSGALISDLDTFTLKSQSRNLYVTAVGGGGGALTVNAVTPGANETFTYRKTEQP